MNHNRLTASTERSTSLRSRAKKAIAVTAMAGTLAGGLAACSGGSEATPKPSKTTTTAEATPRPQQTAETQLKAVEQQAEANLQQHATEAANSVLSILSNPKSGTENYDKYFVGNKAALVGADQKYPTADDAKYRNFPESLARYYPETNQILIRATGEHNETSDNPSFWSVDTLFKVGSSNPITKQTGQLTAADFRTALADQSSVSLVAVSGQENWSYDKNSNKETGSKAGMWLSEAGFIPDDGDLAVYNALDNRLPVATEALTDPNKVVSKVNDLTAILDTAANQLVVDTQR